MDIKDVRLISLFPELSAIEIVDSNEELDPIMDSVIGELPDYLKGVYALLQVAKELMKQAIIKSKSITDSSGKIISDREIIENLCKMCKATAKYESLRTLFKTLARNEFGLWGDTCCSRLGVRKGFLLVK